MFIHLISFVKLFSDNDIPNDTLLLIFLNLKLYMSSKMTISLMLFMDSLYILLLLT